MRRPENPLLWGGIVGMAIGVAGMCYGGSKIMRCPEFMAPYFERRIDAVYYEKPVEVKDQRYFREQARDLTTAAEITAAGLGVFLGSLVVTKYSQTSLPKVRKREIESFYTGQVSGQIKKRERTKIG